MLRCWQHDPLKRPKFTDIGELLPDMKPEQLKTVQSYAGAHGKKDHLLYRQNEIISVLDRSSNSAYWKGVLNSGKTGIFNPAHTVTYLGSLPSSTNPNSSFVRTIDRSSKRKLRTEMISNPQNDFKHTGHVGLDGAYFGDVAFYSSNGSVGSQNVSYFSLLGKVYPPSLPAFNVEALCCSTIKCPGRSSHRTSRPKTSSRHHCCFPQRQPVPIRCKRQADTLQSPMEALEVPCPWVLWVQLVEVLISLGQLSTSISRIRLPSLRRIRL